MKATVILFCLFVLLAVFDARPSFRLLAEEADKDAKTDRGLQYYYGNYPGYGYGYGYGYNGTYYGGYGYYGRSACSVYVWECPNPEKPDDCAYVPKC